MSSVLQKEHHRAIASLSLGMGVPDVARDSDVAISTVYKWMNIPEFRSTLNMEIKQRQAAIDFQYQIMATESAESQLDAQRELRSITLRKEPADYARVMSMQITMKYGQRWADIAGYNVKLKDHKKLLIDLPDDPIAQPVPKVAPALAECAPGDRKNRSACELDPPHPTCGAVTIEDIHANAERIQQLREAQRIEDEQRARVHRAQLRAAGIHAPEPEEVSGDGDQGSTTDGRCECENVPRAAEEITLSLPPSICECNSPAAEATHTGCPCDRAGRVETPPTSALPERELADNSATHASAHGQHEAAARGTAPVRESRGVSPKLVRFRGRDYDLDCCVPASDLFMPIRVRREYEKEQRKQLVANPKGS